VAPPQTNAPGATPRRERDDGTTPIVARRELSASAVRHQAEQLAGYVAKPSSRGASFWLDSKGFAEADRAAIVQALADLEDETGDAA